MRNVKYRIHSLRFTSQVFQPKEKVFDDSSQCNYVGTQTQ